MPQQPDFPSSPDSLLARLSQKSPLLEIEEGLIRTTGTRNEEELLALMWNFPGLSQAGVSFPKLSNLATAASAAGAQFMATAQNAGFFVGGPPQYSHGAMHPPGAAAPPGYQIPMAMTLPPTFPIGPPPAPPLGPAVAPPVVPPPPAGPLAMGAPIDWRLPNWPVRDQGRRGTCVSFASTACSEHFLAGAFDLSEQFLYWAIKVRIGDPWPTTDGTTLYYARTALGSVGICTEALWKYNGVPIPGNISQQSATDPSAPAQTDAGARLLTPGFYQTSGGAAAVLSALQTRQRPVAITVPVFRDVLNPTGDNWNSAVGTLYGRVLDPPPSSVVADGHAVCVTGFQPDPSEPSGGWFIFRNSWDTVWATQAPSPGYFSPEVGYGQISATYIDKYLCNRTGATCRARHRWHREC